MYTFVAYMDLRIIMALKDALNKINFDKINVYCLYVILLRAISISVRLIIERAIFSCLPSNSAYSFSNSDQSIFNPKYRIEAHLTQKPNFSYE